MNCLLLLLNLDMKNSNRISKKDLYNLTPEQQASIAKSCDQIKHGNFHKNEDVMSEMRKLLKKKV